MVLNFGATVGLEQVEKIVAELTGRWTRETMKCAAQFFLGLGKALHARLAGWA
jgi:hypothetical protein